MVNALNLVCIKLLEEKNWRTGKFSIIDDNLDKKMNRRIEFNIEFNGKCENRLLTYIEDEHSFYMEPYESSIDLDLVINYLDLTAIDQRIIDISGYCPYEGWIQMEDRIPKYSRGSLIYENDLEPGFSYRIYHEELPVYVNTNSDWVCIGNPQIQEEAVEFINNCVAVVDHKKLVALWLKPQSLPNYWIERKIEN